MAGATNSPTPRVIYIAKLTDSRYVLSDESLCNDIKLRMKGVVR